MRLVDTSAWIEWLIGMNSLPAPTLPARTSG